MRLLGIHDGALTQELCAATSLLRRDHGAVASFLGVVRNHARGRAVTGLHYECYRPMAERMLAVLADEAAAKFDPALAVALRHGVGAMVPGQVSVCIHAGSAHRDAAFAACRHLIERLKQDLPVWKRETYADGTSEWLRGS